MGVQPPDYDVKSDSFSWTIPKKILNLKNNEEIILFIRYQQVSKWNFGNF